MTPSATVIRLASGDNVAVACRPLARGERIHLGELEVEALDPVAPGHKIALAAIAAGEPIRKYGQTIGFATAAVAPGAHVHTHNCGAGRFERDAAIGSAVPPAPEPGSPRTFRGFARPDGRVGTRNYVTVVSTVNCSASVSRAIAERVAADLPARFPHVDGVLPITHKTGCGMAYEGADHEQLERTLAGFVRHPNVGAALVVGLGCEIGQASHLLASPRLVQVDGVSASAEAPPPPVLTIQEEGGTSATVAAGARALDGLLARANEARRSEVPARHLVVGLECGGSDGYSGVTANPALGVASDLVVAQGGTAVLGETPEIYGAEHLLTRRAISREVGEALLERIRWWEWYTGIWGAELDNNPTPGNKAGGLTTIYEKSLGAIAKGGSTALRAVYRYAEAIDEPGFVVMDTPGYDPVSLTGIVAGGANVCVFTTGRGSVYGCKPAPSIKVATNPRVYERLRGDMDVDAGRILAGTPVEEVGAEIFERILAVASGERTLSEEHGVGEEEFAPWSIGPTL